MKMPTSWLIDLIQISGGLKILSPIEEGLAEKEKRKLWFLPQVYYFLCRAEEKKNGAEGELKAPVDYFLLFACDFDTHYLFPSHWSS